MSVSGISYIYSKTMQLTKGYCEGMALPEPTHTPTKVALLDDFQDVGRTLGPWARLGERVEVTAFTETIAGEDALAVALEPFDVIVAMRERTAFPRSLIERLGNLRLLVTTGMANAAIDMQALRERGVTVCGTTGSFPATLELTWALLLGVARHLGEEDRAIREGGWQHTIGTEVAGRTLGLVGLGRIGSAMVPVAHAFGMDVIAWSANLTVDGASAAGAERVEKQELFTRADFVSIHYSLSERSRGIVGTREIARMKPTAFLVNTSRGPLVDTQALLEALREGRIAGAALDVYDQEPLPVEHPLRSAPRTLLSPHLGYVASGAYERWWREIVEDVETFLDGDPVRVIDPLS
jgi:phosphoglycerate dehydrogenase-like enzyme